MVQIAAEVVQQADGSTDHDRWQSQSFFVKSRHYKTMRSPWLMPYYRGDLGLGSFCQWRGPCSGVARCWELTKEMMLEQRFDWLMLRQRRNALLYSLTSWHEKSRSLDRLVVVCLRILSSSKKPVQDGRVSHQHQVPLSCASLALSGA